MKRALDLALLRAWTWMALTIGACYLHLMSGWTQQRWARGVAPQVVDETEPSG